MTTPNAPITPPRVPIIDPKTGFVDRAWFMFFLSLYNSSQSIVGDISPTTQDTSGDLANLFSQSQLASLISSFDISLQAEFTKALESLQITPASNDLSTLIKAIQADKIAPVFNEQIIDVDAFASAPAYTPQLSDKRYGSFFDVNDQTAAAINTAYAITFSDTQFSLGVTRGSPTSQIYVDRPSIYNIQFSAQLDKTSASLGNVWIWLDHNGTTEANTATQVSLQGSSAATVAAWNFLLEMNAGDYFRLMWATDDIDCYIKHDTAVAPVPAIPSVILTVTDNIK